MAVPEEIRDDAGEQVKYGFDRAAAVFTGKVVRAEKTKGANGKTGMTVKVVFSVDKIWKGNQTKSFIIYTTGIGSLCGYQFKVGKKYLIYAYQEATKNSAQISARAQKNRKMTKIARQKPKVL